VPNNPPPPQNNPYASAASAYDQSAHKNTPDQRELEARVLMKATKSMQDLQQKWGGHTDEELNDVLTYNRQIWMMFVDTAIEDENPNRSNELRSNIANLGLFIFNQTIDIQAAPQKEKLDVLIQINRDIASGLMNKTKTSDQEKALERQQREDEITAKEKSAPPEKTLQKEEQKEKDAAKTATPSDKQ
jgi:flagellar protein FlaF